MSVQLSERKMGSFSQAEHNYPRVLIIYMSCINEADQFGVSIRNWFAEWPKENLAQIYSGGDVGDQKFCGVTFKLGPSERFLGRIFFKLKGSTLGVSSQHIDLDQGNHALKQLDRIALIRNRLSGIMLNSGIWELIFRPVLSKRLIHWVQEFNPDVIYCQGYSLSFAWLPVMLGKKLGIPICFQTGDDWPNYLYKNSIFAWVVRPIVQKTVQDLVAFSAIRFANGDLMALEYAKRYGLPFEKIMIGDSIDRFKQSEVIRVVGNEKISIIYTGNLGQGRWESLTDLCAAAEILSADGLDIVVSAFTSAIPQEAVNTLINIKNLDIFPGLAHDLVPAYLKGADILFLPETFDYQKAQAIQYSISTKATLYMMSECPILVYASPITGIVDYAKRDKWAYVVDERLIDALVIALRSLIQNNSVKNQLIETARDVSLRNHDEKKIRKRFLEAIQATIIESRV